MAHDKELTAGEILGETSAYWRSCALHAAVKLNIFGILDRGPMDLGDIVDTLSGDTRGAEALLNAMVAMGILKKKGEKFANTEISSQHLVRGKDAYIGHIILHHHHLVERWSRLHEAVLSGHPPEVTSHGEEEERESFLLGMHNLASMIAPSLSELINLNGRKKLLDLGGGPGTHAIYFCRTNPELKAVIFDRETTRPFAEKTISRFNLSDRITFAGGNFNTDPLPGMFDVIWMSQILHSYAPEECRALIDKAASALEPGGILMIHEFFLDDAKDGPLFPALFSLNMLVNNDRGRSYSEKEISQIMTDAGLLKIARHPFQGPNDSFILCGLAPE